MPAPITRRSQKELRFRSSRQSLYDATSLWRSYRDHRRSMALGDDRIRQSRGGSRINVTSFPKGLTCAK